MLVLEGVGWWAMAEINTSVPTGLKLVPSSRWRFAHKDLAWGVRCGCPEYVGGWRAQRVGLAAVFLAGAPFSPDEQGGGH